MRGRVAALAAAFVFSAGVAQAAIIDISGGDKTLDDVVGNQFIVGDKLFTITSFTSASFAGDQIFIVPYIAGDPQMGRGFDLTGAFQDFVRGDALVSEFALEYTVEIVDDPAYSDYWIVDNRLIFNGNAGGASGSFCRVDESVVDFMTGALIGQKSVFDIVRDPRETQLEDLLEFDPVKKLQIVKNAKFYAATDCCDATASFIRQSFSQVPEPGGIALVGLGALFVARRRR